MKVTEKTVQNALYRYLQRSGVWPIFPNMDCLTGYEADILTITRSGYAHEYEIKLSLSDFKAYQKKRHKHASLKDEFRTIPHPFHNPAFPDRHPATVNVLHDSTRTDGWGKLADQVYPERKPKRFWYVVHGFIVPPSEIPSYAGLLRYNPEVHWCV